MKIHVLCICFVVKLILKYKILVGPPQNGWMSILVIDMLLDHKAVKRSRNIQNF